MEKKIHGNLNLPVVGRANKAYNDFETALLQIPSNLLVAAALGRSPNGVTAQRNQLREKNPELNIPEARSFSFKTARAKFFFELADLCLKFNQPVNITDLNTHSKLNILRMKMHLPIVPVVEQNSTSKTAPVIATVPVTSQTYNRAKNYEQPAWTKEALHELDILIPAGLKGKEKTILFQLMAEKHNRSVSAIQQQWIKIQNKKKLPVTEPAATVKDVPAKVMAPATAGKVSITINGKTIAVKNGDNFIVSKDGKIQLQRFENIEL